MLRGEEDAIVNRAERRAAASEMRRNAQAWPAHLVEVPKDEWPAPGGRSADSAEYPVALWRSRQFLASLFAVPGRSLGEARRLTVNRVTIRPDGHWEQDISWDDLQRCKRETGHGDWYGVEIYPRDRDIVQVANMRHIWMLATPLPLGWFDNEGAP